MFHSPFDQPSYGKKAKAKKKRRVAKKVPARKKAKKKRRVAKKKVRSTRKKAPVRKAKKADDRPVDWWRLDVTMSDEAVAGFAVNMTRAGLRGWLADAGVPSPSSASKTKLVGMVVATRRQQEGGEPSYPAEAPRRSGHPHKDIAPGQHWSFVYHGQFGFLITHGKVVSARGERCGVKPTKSAERIWVPDTGHPYPHPDIPDHLDLSTAGAMVECHSQGDLVRSRLVEPYTSKAQFMRLAATLKKVYERFIRESRRGAPSKKVASSRKLEDRALSDPASLSLSAYRKVMLSLKPILVYHPNSGDKITEASIKRHYKAAVEAAKPIKPSSCPRGWYQEGEVYVHPEHQAGIVDRKTKPLPATDTSGLFDNRFAVATRNTSGRGRFKWYKSKGHGTLKAAMAEIKTLLKKGSRQATPSAEIIVVTPKQIDTMLKKGKVWFKHKGEDYWPARSSKDEIVALVETTPDTDNNMRAVRFVRADSKLDTRIGRGPGYVPRGPWSEAKKNPIPEAGDRVELIEMPEDPYPVATGSRGTVRSVQLADLGGGMLGGTTTGGLFQVMVDWDHGRGLMLSIPPDRIRIIGKRNPRRSASPDTRLRRMWREWNHSQDPWLLRKLQRACARAMWSYDDCKKIPRPNPAAVARQHVKDKPYEAFRKTVTPVLKKVDRLLTKRSLGLIQAAADERLAAALEAWGPANTGSVQSLRLYYVPLAENLQAELAEAKQAAAAMRARATRQKGYNAATKGFTRASWEITENILRVSDLMKWEDKRLHKKALDLFHELTETLRPGRALASNPHPERWRTNPQGFLFPARRI